MQVDATAAVCMCVCEASKSLFRLASQFNRFFSLPLSSFRILTAQNL